MHIQSGNLDDLSDGLLADHFESSSALNAVESFLQGVRAIAVRGNRGDWYMQAYLEKDHPHQTRKIGSLEYLSCVMASPSGERPKPVSFPGRTSRPSEAALCVMATRCKNSDTFS